MSDWDLDSRIEYNKNRLSMFEQAKRSTEDTLKHIDESIKLFKENIEKLNAKYKTKK